MYNYPNYNMGNYNVANYPQISQPQYQQSMNPTPIQSGLNGKIVESADIVKTIEVPFNGYGVFPKADGTEIFIKQWQPDGTTRIDTYTKVVPDSEENMVSLEQVLSSIQALSEKVDALQKPTTTRKKKLVEVDDDE